MTNTVTNNTMTHNSRMSSSHSNWMGNSSHRVGNNSMSNAMTNANTMADTNPMTDNSMSNNTMTHSNSRDSGNTIIGDLRDVSGDVISMIVDMLDTAVGKVDAVVSLPSPC